MESTEAERPKKKASKDVSEVKEKRKKEKKPKAISAVEGAVKDASTVEEKKSTKQKKEVNKEAKPDKKEKKEKKSKDITTPDEPVTGKDSKPPKRKRDTKDDSSTSKKKSKKTASDTLPEELEIDISAPNPPSKKALRLQKKGKPVPKLPSTSLPPTTLVAAANTDTTHPDRQKLVKEIPRAEWSVWIGNLSYKSDVKGLRGWLVRGDKRVTDKDITRINLPLNADGQSKGFAYVDFLTQEAMEMVISRSEENFDGRNLLIKNAKSFDGRPAERKQRYQVKNMPGKGGRMQVESSGTASGKEDVAEEPKEQEGLKKEKRKRTGEEKIKKAKKVKET